MNSCPIRTTSVIHVLKDNSGVLSTERYNQCVEADCAWWDNGRQACVIHSLAAGVRALAENLRPVSFSFQDGLTIETQERPPGDVE